MLSAQGVERVCVDVERNESQEAHKPKRISTSVFPSSEGVDGSQSVQVVVPALRCQTEEESGAVPRITKDHGYMKVLAWTRNLSRVKRVRQVQGTICPLS